MNEQRYAVWGYIGFGSIIEGRHSRLKMFMSGKEETKVNKTGSHGGEKKVTSLCPKEIRIRAMSEVGRFRK